MICRVPRSPVCVAIALCVQAAAFQLVTVAGIGWITYSAYNVGLFRECKSNTCVGVSDTKDWWKVTQAFSILGLFAITGTLAFGILQCFVEDSRVLSRCGIASCFTSVTFLVIEFSVFVGKTSAMSAYFSWGYGFVLSIIACILCFFTGVMFVADLHHSSPTVHGWQRE